MGAAPNSGRFSPALEAVESAELEELIDEREDLREQLKHVRELSSRLIDRVDEQDQKIELLRGGAQAQRGAHSRPRGRVRVIIAHASSREEHVKVLKGQLKELEASTDELTAHTSRREERISQLEGFLKMIADAEEKDG